MSPPSGSKGSVKTDKKRKRENKDDDDGGNPKKRGNEKNELDSNGSKEHQQEQPQKNKISSLRRSKNTGGRVQTKCPERAAQKRKIEEEEEEEEASKKRKCDDDGATPSSSTPAPLGLSHLHFLKELGKGAYGTVFLASLKSKNATVAVKAMAKKKLKTIQREKRVLLRSSENPYICQTFAGFQTQTHGFLLMEYLSGGNLAEMVEAGGPIDVKTTAVCSAEIVCGIKHLHDLGVIHRDLKMDNILIDHQGHIRICDFGLAAENVFGTNTLIGLTGTPYYMAPEILNYMPYGSSADWWAFGVILYRLLTQSFPFSAANMQEFRQIVSKREPTYPKHLTEEAKDILMKFLCKERRKRLGLHGDLRKHPFYAGIDWQKIENKTIEPPFLPKLDQNSNSSTSQPLALSYLQASEGHACPPDAKSIPDFSFERPEWPF